MPLSDPNGCSRTHDGPDSKPLNFQAAKYPNAQMRILEKMSSFTKGSNIPGLSSENIMETEENRKPKLPSTKVKDLGKDILKRANRCTWYEGIIQNKANDEDNSPEGSVAENLEEKKVPSPGNCTETKTETLANVPSKDPKHVMFEKSEVKKEEPVWTLSKEMDPVFLRRLEEQQMEIMKQQKDLQDKIDMRIHAQRMSSSEQTNANSGDSPMIKTDKKAGLTPVGIPNRCHRWSYQRRLKGQLAPELAKRDEGCLQSIIWYQNNDASQ